MHGVTPGLAALILGPGMARLFAPIRRPTKSCAPLLNFCLGLP
jgi:hypothetical protein